jgi:regulatory protein
MNLFEKYLASAYYFLNYRPRSEKEVRDKLRDKKATPDIIEKIIAKLKEQRFLNDKTFSQLWIESHMKSKPKSKFVLRMELKKKGISEEIIESVMQNSESRIQNDLEVAKDLVERKIKKYKGLERQKIYQKLGGFLVRRGFNWEVSKKAIDDALDKGNDF